MQRLAPLALAFAITSWIAVPAAAQQRLPYSAVDHPRFVRASQATYLSPGDLLIGIVNGAVAKAYPAAIVAQHGVVQDRMPDGPIAVTW